MKNVKQTVIDIIPAVAVFGIAAVAAYGISKIVSSIKDMDFPLDFGNDVGIEIFRSEIDED